MAEYIDLNNTEVLAEAGENAKLVVEEDGELKRIPAQDIGKAVNWDQLQGKPFYEQELLKVEPSVDANNLGIVWRKVSDNNLSTPLENGLNAQAWMGVTTGTVNVYTVGDFVIYGEFFAVFVKKANAVLDCAAIGLDMFGILATFPEVGMYFAESPEPLPLLGLAVAGASEPEITWDGSSVRIKPLDAKFLPEGVGGKLFYYNDNNRLCHDAQCTKEVTYDEGVAAMNAGVIRISNPRGDTIQIALMAYSYDTGIQFVCLGDAVYYIGEESTKG